MVDHVSPAPAVALLRPAFDGNLASVGPFAERAASSRTSHSGKILAPGASPTSLTIDSPSGVGRHPVVLWVHGGGFIAGNVGQIGAYTRVLASAGYVIARLDYSLAPAARYPTPLLQAAAAIQYLADHATSIGIDPTRVFVAGDSAGAQIASELAALITDPSFQQRTGVTVHLPAQSLRGAVLACGLYDMTTVGSTGFPAVRTFLWAYTGDRDYLHSNRINELSTVQHVSAAYPPTFLTVGDADPFEPQARQLKAALNAAGVTVSSRFWTRSGLGLPHEYQFDLGTRAGRTALRDVEGFLEQHSK